MPSESAAGPPRRGPAGWLLLLIFIFTIWNPANLALRLGASVVNLSSLTTLALLFLGCRLVVTSIGVAAGRALWLRRPGAVSLAKASLMLFGLEAVVRLSTRVGLSDAPPGTRLPLALLVILHNGAWYLYLEKSRRVRAIYAAPEERTILPM